MAIISLTELVNTMTPNEAITAIDTNFDTVETAVNAHETMLAAGGTIVNTEAVQTLSNKTMVSAMVSPGTNVFSLSRRDIKDTTLFNVLTYSKLGLAGGTITNIKVDEVAAYNLTISGGLGIRTYADSQILHLDLEEDIVLPSVDQTLVMGSDTLTTGFMADFAGHTRVRNKLVLGLHTGVPSEDFYFKPSSVFNDFTGRYGVAAGFSIYEKYYVNTTLLQKLWDGTTWTVSIAGSNKLALTTAGLTLVGSLAVSGDLTGATFKGTVHTDATIMSGIIDTGQLAVKAVTLAKMATDSVDTEQLVASGITAVKLSLNCVTEGKISTGAVTADKLGAESVTVNKLGVGAVTGAKLNSNAFGNSLTLLAELLNVKVADETLSVETGGLKVGNILWSNLEENIVDDTTSSGILGDDKILSASQTAIRIAENAGWFNHTNKIYITPTQFQIFDANNQPLASGHSKDYNVFYVDNSYKYGKVDVVIPRGYKATYLYMHAASVDGYTSRFSLKVATHGHMDFQAVLIDNSTSWNSDRSLNNWSPASETEQYLTIIVRGPADVYGATITIEKL